jgi:hypothetical protein
MVVVTISILVIPPLSKGVPQLVVKLVLLQPDEQADCVVATRAPEERMTNFNDTAVLFVQCVWVMSCTDFQFIDVGALFYF